jgi:hypothetical protein
VNNGNRLVPYKRLEGRCVQRKLVRVRLNVQLPCVGRDVRLWSGETFSAESAAVRLLTAKSVVLLSTIDNNDGLASVEGRIRFVAAESDVRLFLVEGRIRRFAAEIQEPVIRVHVISRSVLPHYSLLDEMNDRAECQPGVTYIVIVKEHP